MDDGLAGETGWMDDDRVTTRIKVFEPLALLSSVVCIL